MFFVAFLIVYGILIVTKFYQYPFVSPGRGHEICVLLYVCGIGFEELLQASVLFAVYLCIVEAVRRMSADLHVLLVSF